MTMAIRALLLAVLAFTWPAQASPGPQDTQDTQDQAGDAGEPDPINALPWQIGPTTAKLGERATLEVPEGYAFLDAEATKQFNTLMQNPSGEADEYTLAPLDLHWQAYFIFDPIGYVKDDEQVDPDDVLETVREGTQASNVERRRKGWPELQVLGWSFKPQYDTALKSLEWAIDLETLPDHAKSVNYNTRLLGRRGVMRVIVVAAPEQLDASIAEFKQLMAGYDYVPGERYAEFREGDHVAEIGLAALITGGAAAAAAKKGFFAAIAVALLKAWKLVLVGLAAVGAAVRKVFKGRAEKAAAEAAAEAAAAAQRDDARAGDPPAGA